MPEINPITLAILSFYPEDKINYNPFFDGFKRFYTALENCQPKYSVLKDLKFDHKSGYPFCHEVDNIMQTCKIAGVLEIMDFSSPNLEIKARQPRQEFLDKGQLTEDELNQLEEITKEIFRVMTANPN